MLNKLWNSLIKLIWLKLFIVMLPAMLEAQTHSLPLTVEEAVDSALANNREISLTQLDERIAAAKLKETKAIFLPQVDFSYTALSTNNPLNVFGFKLQQQLVKQEDFNPVLLNNPDDAGDFTTRLQVKQPIVNMDLLYMRKALTAQTALYQFKTKRIKEYLAFEVKKAYMQVQLAYDAETVLKEALKTAQAMYQFTSNRVKEGLMQQSDALNVKVWITTVETYLAEAQSNIRNASDYLSLLMGRPYGNVYTVTKATSDANNILGTVAIPGNRADFEAVKKAIEASDLMIKSSKMSFLPKLNAFGSYQLNDNRMLGFGANSYLAGVQLSWDIFKGNSTKNKIATQQIERKKLSEQLQSQLEQSNLELNKATRQLADAKYKMKQQQTAMESAAEALRILQDRYEQGLVNSTDVLRAQTQLSEQKNGFVQAVFNHNVTAAYIQFLTVNNK